MMSNAPAPYPIAVLISGSGSTLRNLLEWQRAGRLQAQVAGVVASRECSGLDHAREFGVPSTVVARPKPFDAADFSRRIEEALAA